MSEDPPEIIKGPAGDTDPATQQWRAENWEHDEKKAEEMAHAEDPWRTGANLSEQAADRYRQESRPEDAAESLDRASRLREKANTEGKIAGGYYDDKHQIIVKSGEADTTSQEMYVYDSEKFDTETIKDIQLETGIGQGRSQAVNNIRGLLNKREKERRWSEEFSGKVPKSWGEVETGVPWHQALADITNPEIELSDDMIVAAIKHPIPHLCNFVVTRRRLSAEQMQLVESLQDTPYWLIEEMRNAQQALSTGSNPRTEVEREEEEEQEEEH